MNPLGLIRWIRVSCLRINKRSTEVKSNASTQERRLCVQQYVIGALTRERAAQLTKITEAALREFDPDGTKTAVYRR
jgi:hypothetical protein